MINHERDGHEAAKRMNLWSYGHPFPSRIQNLAIILGARIPYSVQVNGTLLVTVTGKGFNGHPKILCLTKEAHLGGDVFQMPQEIR